MNPLTGFLALVLLAASGATGAAAPAMAADPGTDPASHAAVAVPASQVDAAIAALDGIVARHLAATGIPGISLAVVRDGQVALAKGYGVRQVGSTDAVDADTVFQVASVSKPIGASVVAAVVGSTRVKWTDPVRKYDKSFALSDRYVTKHATIGDLYSMRAGIPYEAGDDLESLGYSRAQILHRLRYLPLAPFRAQSQYTNFGLTAGAQAVAKATGTPWNELSAQRIYRPLGMSRTTSSYPALMAMTNRATLHVPGANGTWEANGNRDEHAQSPAGMVATTANDMAKWMIMELAGGAYQGKQVVDAAALQESRVPRITSSEPTNASQRASSYGYGIGITVDGTGRVRYAFSGAFSAGAATTFALVPDLGLGISVFTNAYPLGMAEAISAEFLDLVETGSISIDWAAYMGKVLAARIGGPDAAATPAASTKAPELALRRYAGTYSNRYYGTVRVRVTGTGLTAVLGPDKVELPLVPYDGNTFGVESTPGSVVPGATFTARRGRAVAVRFAALAAPGQEILKRR